MTLITCVFVPMGIVISGDSRATRTLSQTMPNPHKQSEQINVQTKWVVSDAVEKLFIVCERFGIGVQGNSHIDNMPIAHHIAELEQ